MVATPLASRVSRKLTREYAPRGSRNSLGNRFTSFSTSLHSFSFHSSSSSSLFLLSPFLTAPRTAANPPYAPSGSYLRVLLIFSYYRRGHVGMFHTHICKSSSYLHGVRSTSKFTGLPPSYSAPFPMFLSSPSLLPAPPAVLLSGTPICEHIITETREERAGRETHGESLSQGSKDEVKRTRVLSVDEENARVSERSCKGV